MITSLEDFKKTIIDMIDSHLDRDDEECLEDHWFYFDEFEEAVLIEIMEKMNDFDHRGFCLEINEDENERNIFFVTRQPLPDDYPIEDVEYFEVTNLNDQKVIMSMEGTQQEIHEFHESLLSNEDYKLVKKVNYDKIYAPLPTEEQSLIDQMKNLIDYHLEDGKEFDSYWTVPSYGNIEFITRLLSFKYKDYILMPLDDPDKSVTELAYLTFRIEKE